MGSLAFNTRMIKLIVFSTLLAGCLSSTLVSLSGKRQIGSRCCSGDHILSCRAATVNVENLDDSEINLPGGLTLNFLNRVSGNSNSFHYGSEDGEAVITMNAAGNGLHGHATTADGHSFVLEFCGVDGHVWKKIDVDNMPGDEGVELPENRIQLLLPVPEVEPVFNTQP